MKKMVAAASITLFALAGVARAEGTLVRWNAIVGLNGHESGAINLEVGPLTPGANWVYVDSGFATLNLDTGRVHIVVRYVSWASNNLGTLHPLGATLDGAPFARRGKFVCDARGAQELVVTEPFFLDRTGSANYEGTVYLPESCREQPDQIVFVIGGGGNDTYFAYGAGRVVLGTDL